jgi:hypothetical protein
MRASKLVVPLARQEHEAGQIAERADDANQG